MEVRYLAIYCVYPNGLDIHLLSKHMVLDGPVFHDNDRRNQDTIGTILNKLLCMVDILPLLHLTRLLLLSYFLQVREVHELVDELVAKTYYTRVLQRRSQRIPLRPH